MVKESQIQNKIKLLSSFIGTVTDISTAASSIPEKQLIEPNLPVGIFIQESINIHFYAQHDHDILVLRGLNWGIVDELRGRIEHLQTCEAVWWKARFSLSPLAKEYLRVRELALTTSAELMRALEHLADTDDEITAAINNIKKGSDNQDFFADIIGLYGLCKNEQEKLKPIGCRPQLLDEMEHCIATLPNLQMDYNLDPAGSTAYRMRNQAYTFLLVAIEEIRRCARHAFWNDKKHLKGYQSEYFRRRKS